MISEQAKQGLNFIFTRAATDSLALEPDDFIVIEPAEGGFLDPKMPYMVLLTIASYSFRLLIIFHLAADRDTLDYFAKSTNETELLNVFPEICNLCCGAMNRDLGKHFPHLGMSTPSVLDGKCLPFIQSLKPTHVTQHRISINRQVVMHATLCLTSFAPIDFQVDRSAPQELTGGLELF